MAAICAGLVVALPTLATGFFADDDAMIAYLDGRAPYNPPWFDIYRFTPDDPAGIAHGIARGQFAWWSAPFLHLHLLRPIPSLLLTLDHALFAQRALGYHVHSILWWLLTMLAARLVYARILPGATGALALLLYATADSQAMTYAWVSARHSIVAAAPALVALWAAVRWREHGWAPGRWVAPAAMVLALLGGEVALGGLAFWASYEALGPRAPPAWSPRFRRAAMPIAIGVVYLAAYRAFGGGVRGSGAYVDPTDLGTFVQVAAKRFPALLATAFVDFPSELAAVLPAAPFHVIGGLSALGVWILWRGVRPLADEQERAAVRWVVPAACLSMLGAVGGFPGGRLLIVANLGWSVLLAVLLRHGFRRDAPLLGPRRLAVGFLAFVHVVASPLLAVLTTFNTAYVARLTAEIAHSPVLAEGPPERQTVFLQASDPMVYLYPTALRIREGLVDPRACSTTLSGSAHGVRVTRTGPETLTVEPRSGSFVEGPFEVLYRSPKIPFAVGDTATACNAHVTVLAVNEARLPTRIEARFDRSLEDPTLRLVAWKDGALAAVTLEVGQTLDVPWSPGPMQMF